MVAILLHVLPYQGPRLNGVVLSSERMHMSSHIRVCKGKPNSLQTLTGVWTILPRLADECTDTLKSSRTHKSVRTCCHDVRTDATLNYSKLLYTEGSPDGIATSSGLMLLTDEHPDILLGHLDGNKGSDFFELESVQNLS
jgi:hypothetical protein